MNFINKITAFIIRQSGMKRNFLAWVLGVLAAAALPPVYIFPLAIIGFCGFFLLIQSSINLKSAFKIGWWFGFGHFTAGLYWIAFALLVDLSSFWWLIPFAVLGIPAVLAIYIGIVAMVTFKASKSINGWRLVIIFACSWTLIEMLRGWLFTGFPWNLAGYMLVISENILQFASIGGIWGLSLLVMLVFTMPVLLVSGGQQNNNKANVVPNLVTLGLMALIFVWGGYRLSHAETKYVPDVKLRIIQANVPQNMKWEDEWRYATVQKYLDMSTSAGFESITHVIWPETALPFTISEDSAILNEIAKAAPPNGAVITGALHGEFKDGFLSKIYNSLAVINSKGKLYSRYDKSHLVPFGEYVPFRNILPIEKITNGALDFSEGDGAKTINAPNFPTFGGLICYEVIFPGRVVQKTNRPQVLVNVTNDAWYGNTSGPYQHFQISRVRAVEEGIPLIRAANNGISGVIDAYGRVVLQSKLSTHAILDSPLPTEIQPFTTYGKIGSSGVVLWVVILLILCKIIRIRND